PADPPCTFLPNWHPSLRQAAGFGGRFPQMAEHPSFFHVPFRKNEVMHAEIELREGQKLRRPPPCRIEQAAGSETSSGFLNTTNQAVARHDDPLPLKTLTRLADGFGC